jgi:hypothetical protein
MLRLARTAIAAVLVAATSALVPAAAVAAERATLEVTAHVVNRCTVTVPPWVASSKWLQWRHEPRHFVRHECHGHPPFWLQAARVWFRQAGDQGRAPRRQDASRRYDRHPSRKDVILITITY